MARISRMLLYFSQQRWTLIALTSLYPCALLLFLLVQHIFPQHDGVLAITQVFAPYLFLPLLFLIPFAFLSRTMLLRLILVVCLLAFSFTYFPRIPFHASSDSTSRMMTSVLSWNMEVGHSHDALLLPLLKEKHPAIVALEEVDPGDTFTQSPDFKRLYAYQLAQPTTNVPYNLALLSIYPIIEYGTLKTGDDTWAEPQAQVLWARLDLGSGQRLVVIIGHPVSSIHAVANCYFCSERRDGQLRSLNAFAHSFMFHGEAVLLAGDMNVTDREPGYASLTASLQDAFQLAGTGSGHTWGFHRLNPYWPMLRIDYLLASPRVHPTTFDVDCAPRASDHCVIWGQFGLL
ncbi:endonuclease/exonuclease/phosphatase family protein [Ktedonobacter robiniae]|nr:endonuclease/exonuclease/phosphatase family protein [Ktedonobacter robiniae]